MNKETSKEYTRPPFVDKFSKPIYDLSIEAFIGFAYGLFPSLILWIGILFFIKWLF
jgi:hypothetical protein